MRAGYTASYGACWVLRGFDADEIVGRRRMDVEVHDVHNVGTQREESVWVGSVWVACEASL